MTFFRSDGVDSCTGKQNYTVNKIPLDYSPYLLHSLEQFSRLEANVKNFISFILFI